MEMTRLLVQTFTLPVRPTPKGRPRFAIHQGRARTYTPDATQQAEASIRAHLVNSGAQLYPRRFPVSLEVVFLIARPHDAPRREVWPARRPDLTNYLMLLADAGTGVLWADDSQLVAITAEKQLTDGDPMIVVSAGVLVTCPIPKPAAQLAYERELKELLREAANLSAEERGT